MVLLFGFFFLWVKGSPCLSKRDFIFILTAEIFNLFSSSPQTLLHFNTWTTKFRTWKDPFHLFSFPHQFTWWKILEPLAFMVILYNNHWLNKSYCFNRFWIFALLPTWLLLMMMTMMMMTYFGLFRNNTLCKKQI